MKNILKNNLTAASRWVATGLLLIAACALIGRPAQAQISARNGSRGVTISPEGLAAMAQAGQLDHDGAMALHAGRYAEAEATERKSLAVSPFHTGIPVEILAQALDAQGKEQEALQAYEGLVADRHPSHLLSYALLLLKSGRWEQAVAAYNQALPQLGEGELEQASSHFSPDTPEPAALATAIHIERGQLYNAAADWAGEPQNTEALAEYAKALQLAPDSPLANYYYGVGWQKLSTVEQAKAGGSVQQAKAALRKAVLLGKGGVKKAAQKALLVAMKTKAKTKAKTKG